MSSGAHVLWTCPRTSGTVARIVLAESGLAHETRLIDLRAGEHRSEAFLAVNPKGQIPALTLPDGSVLTEGPAIHLYAARMMPGSALVPADTVGLAHALEWLCWCAWTLACAVQPAFLPGRFAGAAEAEGPVRDAARARLAEAMAFADRSLAGRATLLGTEAPTAPDHYLTVLTIFAARFGVEVAGLADLQRHRARITARPKVAAILAKEGLDQ
jgi:glutathione S-transferase